MIDKMISGFLPASAVVVPKSLPECWTILFYLSVVDEDREKTISLINSKLPPSIRVQAIRKVTKNFNSKSACDARTYLYFLPTFAFAPIFPTSDVDDDSASLLVTKSFKMSPELRTRINQVLKLFVGSRFYHNYTSGK